MGKKRSWKQYRAIDLTMFAGMLVIFEFIIVMAARFWFPGQPFTVSLVAAITTIVYMRWGCWGVIHAMLGGVVYSFMSGAAAHQYLIYVVGNIFSLISVFILIKVGKEKVRTSTLGMLYPILVLLLMQTGSVSDPCSAAHADRKGDRGPSFGRRTGEHCGLLYNRQPVNALYIRDHLDSP